MLAQALLNELFNVFPTLFYVKVCIGAMLSFQHKRVTITNKHVVANFDYV